MKLILTLALILASGLSAEELARKHSRVGLQEITAISSAQFYTNFALIRTMLEGTWNEKRFEQFSYYDGMNLNLMIEYQKEWKDDEIWGPFLEKKVKIQKSVYERLNPLIEKKRSGSEISDDDLEILEELDELISKELI